MDITSLTIWQSLLHTSSTQGHSTLMHCISQSLAKELQTLSPCPLNEQVTSPQEELSKIHHSWFAPFLRSLPENEIKLFLSSLSSEQVQNLKESLLLSNTLPPLSPLGKAFLHNTLFNKIASEDLLPICLLPKDPLNELLDLSQEELSSLIDLLSMHDLSIEIRHVIETSKLKEIYSLLTKAQTTFLKTLIHKKEPVSFKKMGLLGWKGDREELKSMLTQRGINRIAKPLYGKNPSLLWHVSHKMEEEKGQLLVKLCTPLDHLQAAPLLADQVLELINALRTTNPARNL